MSAVATAVELGRRPPPDYEPAAGADVLERLAELTAALEGARILHLSVAGAGSRPASQLGSTLPLALGLGVAAEWRVVALDGPAAAVARQLDDGMRGAETAIGADDWGAYRAVWDRLETDGFDLVVAHDPAALGAAPERGDGRPLFAWHCHTDVSGPDAPLWERARPHVERFDARIVPLASFAPPEAGDVHELQPGIDPLAPRNRELPLRMAGDSLRFLGLDLERPFCCQVGAIDPWEDPHDIVDAFRLAREEVPDLQLVLAGEPLAGDAEGVRLAGEVAEYAAGAEGLHVLTGHAGVGEAELNAMQRLARAVLVKSIRSDFGIAASEALWKGTGVVATPAGGIREQVEHEVHGLLADGPDEIARSLARLVTDPALAIVLGTAGRERVRERFLVTRVLADELALVARLLRATVQHS